MILPVQVGIRDDSVQGLGLRGSGLGFRVKRGFGNFLVPEARVFEYICP